MILSQTYQSSKVWYLTAQKLLFKTSKCYNPSGKFVHLLYGMNKAVHVEEMQLVRRRTHYLPLKYPFMSRWLLSFTETLEKVARLLSVAECNNPLLQPVGSFGTFHKNCITTSTCFVWNIFLRKSSTCFQPVMTILANSDLLAVFLEIST